MVAPKKDGLGNNNKPESSDRPMGGDSSEEPREIDGFESSERRTAGGLTARLRDVLQDESDGDLLLDRRVVETGILPWLRALDLHVLGACRADERLKPLLKLNISNGAAEDMLLAQLSQVRSYFAVYYCYNYYPFLFLM